MIAEVHRLGMRFGLWVEPEMVNPDSGSTTSGTCTRSSTGSGPTTPGCGSKPARAAAGESTSACWPGRTRRGRRTTRTPSTASTSSVATAHCTRRGRCRPG
ncbi:hypothetical protein ALI144C_26365 [Actinosynnema sp. ALI-1.44]|nr:hypothetical protein ALI144C_26365 [Actinosynnema sp. ALI-1.44]